MKRDTSFCGLRAERARHHTSVWGMRQDLDGQGHQQKAFHNFVQVR